MYNICRWRDIMAKKSEKETKSKNIHEIDIKIEGQEWTDALDKVFKQKQKTAKTVDCTAWKAVCETAYRAESGCYYL